MKFNCQTKKSKWEGEIKSYKEYGSHYYIQISANSSGIPVYFGRASFGQWFVCIPDWNASLIVGDLRNTFYNAEKIGVAMENEIDGLSVAQALYVFAEAKNIKEENGTQEYLDALKVAGFTDIEE